MTDPEPTPDPRLGMPGPNQCPECFGARWVWYIVNPPINGVLNQEPEPCRKCNPRAGIVDKFNNFGDVKIIGIKF